MTNALLRIGKVQLQQRFHRISTLPILILCLNDVCNSRCLTCAIWQNNERLKAAHLREMSDVLLGKLYEQIEHWRPAQVLLSGGEPTMHPRFGQVVERIRDLDIAVLVVTNGFLLPSYLRVELSGVSEFLISFDAPDPESYHRIRGVDGFSKMVHGIGHLRTLSPRPKLVARTTLQRENVGLLPELVESARSLGFDRISFLGVDLTSDAFGRNHPDHGVDTERIRPDRVDLDAMELGIELLERSDSAGFVESGIEKLREIRQYFQAHLGQNAFPAIRCNAPWVSAVIETSGNLRGCFFHRVIGDYQDFNSPEAVRFRSSLLVAEDPTCQRCVCSKMLRASEIWKMNRIGRS